MLRYLLDTGYDKVRVFSRDEDKQHTLRTRLADPRVDFYVGDIRERDQLDRAMRGVEHVFHAAALKQVPSCEFFPMEAVRTNVLGSENVMEAAIAAGVSKCVVLSTDKAVFPINAMGMTKALMEKLVAAKARLITDSATTISIVRYGNVLGSRGSVIPLFIDLLLQNRPLTVTDPEMTRFYCRCHRPLRWYSMLSNTDVLAICLFARPRPQKLAPWPKLWSSFLNPLCR
jgi:UDP-glucose 4-epimerase